MGRGGGVVEIREAELPGVRVVDNAIASSAAGEEAGAARGNR